LKINWGNVQNLSHEDNKIKQIEKVSKRKHTSVEPFVKGLWRTSCRQLDICVVRPSNAAHAPKCQDRLPVICALPPPSSTAQIRQSCYQTSQS
jgi:hypothetical protein